jgi:hypothetical protein
MRYWYTFGGAGDTVVELSWWDWLCLAFGGEVALLSIVVCLGKSKRVSLRQAPSREKQLGLKPCSR